MLKRNNKGFNYLERNSKIWEVPPQLSSWPQIQNAIKWRMCKETLMLIIIKMRGTKRQSVLFWSEKVIIRNPQKHQFILVMACEFFVTLHPIKYSVRIVQHKLNLTHFKTSTTSSTSTMVIRSSLTRSFAGRQPDLALEHTVLVRYSFVQTGL